MKTLLLYGNESDIGMGMMIQNYLEGRYGIAVLNDKRLKAVTLDPEILLLETNHLAQIEAPGAVVFLKGRCDLKSIKSISRGCTIILYSANRRQREFAAKAGGRAVTYGFSNRDTITFTSRTEGEYVVALQRSIMSIDGNVIEPMEIPCRKKGKCSDSQLLAFVTLLLVLGVLDGDLSAGLQVESPLAGNETQSRHSG